MLEILQQLGLILLVVGGFFLIVAIVPTPSWVRHGGRNGIGPRLVQRVHTFGEPIWSKCNECGKYVDIKTRKHIEVETLTLKEFLDKYKPECPNKDKKNG